MTTEALLAPVNPETEVLIEAPRVPPPLGHSGRRPAPSAPACARPAEATKEFKNYVEASHLG